jgi:hypothetical protein
MRLISIFLRWLLAPLARWRKGNFVYTNDDRSPNSVSAFSVAAKGDLKINYQYRFW